MSPTVKLFFFLGGLKRPAHINMKKQDLTGKDMFYLYFFFTIRQAESSDINVVGMSWYVFSSTSTLFSLENVVLSVDFILIHHLLQKVTQMGILWPFCRGVAT